MKNEIDFTKYPELQKFIFAMARKEMRPVETQILFMIKSEMERQLKKGEYTPYRDREDKYIEDTYMDEEGPF